jgi:hypothetical protein
VPPKEAQFNLGCFFWISVADIWGDSRKENAVKKYVVKVSAEERGRLEALKVIAICMERFTTVCWRAPFVFKAARIANATIASSAGSKFLHGQPNRHADKHFPKSLRNQSLSLLARCVRKTCGFVKLFTIVLTVELQPQVGQNDAPARRRSLSH